MLRNKAQGRQHNYFVQPLTSVILGKGWGVSRWRLSHRQPVLLLIHTLGRRSNSLACAVQPNVCSGQDQKLLQVLEENSDPDANFATKLA